MFPTSVLWIFNYTYSCLLTPTHLRSHARSHSSHLNRGRTVKTPVKLDVGVALHESYLCHPSVFQLSAEVYRQRLLFTAVLTSSSLMDRFHRGATGSLVHVYNPTAWLALVRVSIFLRALPWRQQQLLLCLCVCEWALTEYFVMQKLQVLISAEPNLFPFSGKHNLLIPCRLHCQQYSELKKTLSYKGLI